METCHNKYHSSLELKFHEFLYSSGVLNKEKVVVPVLGNRSREPQFFALAKPEPECIPVPDPVSVLEPALDPDPTYNGIQKSKKVFKKREANFIGNIASSNIKTQYFVQIF